MVARPIGIGLIANVLIGKTQMQTAKIRIKGPQMLASSEYIFGALQDRQSHPVPPSLEIG